MNRSRRALLAALGAAVVTPVAGCSDAESGPATAPETPTHARSATGAQTASPARSRTGSATPTETATRPGTAGTELVVLSPGESYAASGGWSLTVEHVAVANAVVEFGTTHPNPRWSEDGQIVAADLVVSGEDAPDPADLRVACRTDVGGTSGRFFVAADSNRDDRRQRVGFEVPSAPAPSEGAIVWSPEGGPTVRWTLSDAHLAAVARPPDLRLERFAVADAPGDEVE
ncbi:MAG: hypothetical protein ABEJ26_12575 [Halosimplex sp.]